MKSFPENLGDPEWWWTAVILVVIVNLVSAYLKPLLERIVGQAFRNFGAAARRSLQEFDSEVEALRASAERRATTQLLKIEYLIKIVASFLFSAQSYAAAGRGEQVGSFWFAAVFNTIGVFAAIYGSGCIGRYRRFSATLSRAWKLGNLEGS